MTYEDLARLYKGSKGEISNMVHKQIGLKRAYEIAEILHCSVDDIVDYEDVEHVVTIKQKHPKRNWPKY